MIRIANPSSGLSSTKRLEAVLTVRRDRKSLPELVGPLSRLGDTVRAVRVEQRRTHHCVEHFGQDSAREALHDPTQQQLLPGNVLERGVFDHRVGEAVSVHDACTGQSRFHEVRIKFRFILEIAFRLSLSRLEQWWLGDVNVIYFQ